VPQVVAATEKPLSLKSVIDGMRRRALRRKGYDPEIEREKDCPSCQPGTQEILAYQQENPTGQPEQVCGPSARKSEPS
jgi:hypothetical protein